MKKIIALAVASAFVAPAVMAEVTVYGFLAPSVEYSKISDNGSNDLTRVRLVDNASRIGFKGTDKLDNGLKLFWQVENRVRVGNGDIAQEGFNSRETWVGLEGNFGKVFVGQTNDLIWQSRPDYMKGLNYFNESVDGVHKYTTAKEGRLPNIAQYESPKFLGGAQVKALYDFGKKVGGASNYNVQGYQATALYATKMFQVGATYKQNNDSTETGDGGYSSPANGDFLKTYIIGGTVTPIAGLDISALWTQWKTRDDSAATETKQAAWALGANYYTGKHGFGVHYGKRGDAKVNGATATETGGYAVIGQYKYNLSKQTYAHASVGFNRNDKNANSTIGTTKLTTSQGTVSLAGGAKVTTVTAGIRTNF